MSATEFYNSIEVEKEFADRFAPGMPKDSLVRQWVLTRLSSELVSYLGITDTHYRIDVGNNNFVYEKLENFYSLVNKLRPYQFAPVTPEPPRDDDFIIGDRWEAVVFGVPVTFTHYRQI